MRFMGRARPGRAAAGVLACRWKRRPASSLKIGGGKVLSSREVSQVCNRHVVSPMGAGLESLCGLPNAIRRYRRVQLCATTLCRPSCHVIRNLEKAFPQTALDYPVHKGRAPGLILRTRRVPLRNAVQRSTSMEPEIETSTSLAAPGTAYSRAFPPDQRTVRVASCWGWARTWTGLSWDQ